MRRSLCGGFSTSASTPASTLTLALATSPTTPSTPSSSCFVQSRIEILVFTSTNIFVLFFLSWNTRPRPRPRPCICTHIRIRIRICVRVRVRTPVILLTLLTPLSFMSVHDGLEAFTRVCRSASGFDASRSRTGGGDGGGDGEEGVECSLVV